jgi:hypothetical protein
MNKPTEDPTDHILKTKKDQILESICKIHTKYPTYSIYVTGHSLGAALATISSYYIATTIQTLQRPVTCINFASPRVGDGLFLEAIQTLEQEKRLRVCRFVNDKDLVCVIPTLNYKHVGFMVKLKRDDKTSLEVCYPRQNEGWVGWFGRAWSMSWPVATNLTYDHSIGEYGRRLEVHKKELETLSLAKMYADPKLTGCYCGENAARSRISGGSNLNSIVNQRKSKKKNQKRQSMKHQRAEV